MTGCIRMKLFTFLHLFICNYRSTMLSMPYLVLEEIGQDYFGHSSDVDSLEALVRHGVEFQSA